MKENAKTKQGVALILTLEVVAFIVALTAVLMQLTFSENMGTDSLVLDTQANYLAESGSEYAIRQLKFNIANNYPLPAGANTVVLSGYTPGYGTIPGPTSEYKVIRIEGSSTRTTTDSDGVTHRYQLYAVSGRGYVPDPKNPSAGNEVFVNKMVDLDLVPLFQYLAFYNRFDLEILPGNNATLQGRIHSNRDIYLGAQSGKTLTINTNALDASGAIHRHRKDESVSASDYMMPGTVQIKTRNAAATAPVNATNYPVMESSGQLKTPNGATVPLSAAPYGYDSSFLGFDGNNDGIISGSTDLPSFNTGIQQRWQGSVQVGADGAPVLEAPTDIRAYRPPVNGETPTYALDGATKMWTPASPATATSVPGYFLSHANLVVASNGTDMNLLDSSGKVLFQASGSTVKVNLLQDSGGNPVVPLTQAQMFDAREGKTVSLIDLDVGKLNSAVRTDTNLPIFPTPATDPVGSVLYAYRTDTTSTNPNGIRLIDGASLNNKLTFASEGPVYIKGDFNTVANGKKGAIVLADSVNLLSNQWNDTKTATGTLPKPSGNLEVNAAIMTGAYETIAANGSTPGVYNGGFENFPRFHEDWSGSGNSVNILGSFISLFTSTYAQGVWVYGGNHYTAPVRNWSFDTDFLNPADQPPGFPVSVGDSRVVWWKGRNLDWWPLQ